MTARTGTNATVHVKDTVYYGPTEDQVDFQNRYLRLAARRAFQNTTPSTVRLDPPYFLDMPPVAGWLPLVERRIEGSTLPNEYGKLASTEWLREEVGQAAIRFFQSTADVLPSEPFIYASQTGALVAEFQAPQGSLTTVISPTSIILFAANSNEPNAPPIQVTVQRGSNRLREELKEIVKTIADPMARWDPPDKVGENEHLGRRLFDEPMLAAANDQPSYAGLLLSHFEETRGDEYSLDRLGRSGVDGRIIGYLKPRAEDAGRSFKKAKAFNGWAVLPARELINSRKPPKVSVHASPVSGQEPKDNKYHAHAVKPQNMEASHMALHLRHLFTTFGKIEPIREDRQVHPWLAKLFVLLPFLRPLFGNR